MTRERTQDGPPAAGGRALRADAERNRERVLDAAREVFAEHGLDASTNEIARRAGVGVATLFRRFPTRDDLIAAVFADKMTAYADAIDDALADPDPWHGFCGYIERVCQMQADDRGFADVLTMTFPTAKAFEAGAQPVRPRARPSCSTAPRPPAGSAPTSPTRTCP